MSAFTEEEQVIHDIIQYIRDGVIDGVDDSEAFDRFKTHLGKVDINVPINVAEMEKTNSKGGSDHTRFLIYAMEKDKSDCADVRVIFII